MKKRALFSMLVAGCMVAALFTGCTGEDSGGSSSNTEDSSKAAVVSGSVKISGSTSMEKMTKALAEAFQAKNGGIVVDVQLGGSSAGISNTLDGLSDIGNVSRKLKDSEAASLTGHTIAIDGIAVVINNANTVKDLTMEQIQKIFTGEITNWKDVGGEDAEIVVIGREAGSGTRDGFESVVGVAEKCKYQSEFNETGQVKSTVASTKGAIGYISTSYVDNTVKAVTVGGVEGTVTNIQDGVYALQRPFVMVTKKDAALSPAAQAFLDYCQSAEGIKIITENVKLIEPKK